MKLVHSLVIALAAAASSPLAMGYDGYDLHKGILAHDRIDHRAPADREEFMMSGTMMGFIFGTTETLTQLQLLCTNGMKVGQQVAIVQKYLDDHPTEWQESAVSLIGKAFSGFMCKLPEAAPKRP